LPNAIFLKNFVTIVEIYVTLVAKVPPRENGEDVDTVFAADAFIKRNNFTESDVRPIHRVVTCYLFDAVGRLYIQERMPDDIGDGGQYESLGGGMELFESYHEALLREIEEESGLPVRDPFSEFKVNIINKIISTEAQVIENGQAARHITRFAAVLNVPFEECASSIKLSEHARWAAVEVPDRVSPIHPNGDEITFYHLPLARQEDALKAYRTVFGTFVGRVTKTYNKAVLGLRRR
jgi:8-oxo-dGTP pyrophosphatase MutT (NUDIX family)